MTSPLHSFARLHLGAFFFALTACAPVSTDINPDAATDKTIVQSPQLAAKPELSITPRRG